MGLIFFYSFQPIFLFIFKLYVLERGEREREERERKERDREERERGVSHLLIYSRMATMVETGPE